jgi:hypothetical protein
MDQNRNRKFKMADLFKMADFCFFFFANLRHLEKISHFEFECTIINVLVYKILFYTKIKKIM